ncbi:MAG: ribonuclease [Bacteroidota bacterium]|nr:ribonuclease [Bacteroidota bacterium]
MEATTHKIAWKDILHFGQNSAKRLRAIVLPVWNVMKNTVTLYRAHDTSTLGAGLSYFMVFSIAPILIIIISVAGTILGPKAVEGEIKNQIEGLLGSSTAQQMQDMIKAAYQPGRTWIATVISIVLLLAGAIGVFDQLRSSLNTIWDLKPGAKKKLLSYLVNRLFSFAMIICVAFLLLISLVFHAGLALLSKYIGAHLPALSKIILASIDLGLSFGLTLLLFAFMYKFMSDAKMKWKIVWPGALFTTVLFIAGKYMIGLYIGKSNLANGYGAAGSLIVLLAWVFYSSRIVFFGAEFTRALAILRGEELNTSATKDNKATIEDAKDVARKKDG